MSAELRKKLAELKKKLQRDKPEFRRRLAERFAKFRYQESWRKPKGKDNKMRLQKKGYPPIVKVGYRNPSLIRGLHPSGLVPVVVSNAKELERLDPKKHVVYISSTVGLKKRLELERVAKEKGFKVANEVGVLVQ